LGAGGGPRAVDAVDEPLVLGLPRPRLPRAARQAAPAPARAPPRRSRVRGPPVRRLRRELRAAPLPRPAPRGGFLSQHAPDPRRHPARRASALGRAGPGVAVPRAPQRDAPVLQHVVVVAVALPSHLLLL